MSTVALSRFCRVPRVSRLSHLFRDSCFCFSSPSRPPCGLSILTFVFGPFGGRVDGVGRLVAAVFSHCGTLLLFTLLALPALRLLATCLHLTYAHTRRSQLVGKG